MRRPDTATRPEEWPRDDSWLFADPMSIGGRDVAPVGDGFSSEERPDPRRRLARERSARRAWAAAGIVAGAILGVSTAMLAKHSTGLQSSAAACPRAHSAGPIRPQAR